MTNNICASEENTRPVSRDIEQDIIPGLNDVTPIPDTMVNRGLEAEAFPQELTNYTEEISSQRIPPMVYLDAENNRSNQRGKVQNDENKENSRGSLNPERGNEQNSKQSPLSRRYTEPSMQTVATINSPT